MHVIATSSGSYPRIGGAAELQLLRQSIAQRDTGKKTDADVRAAEDALTRAAIGEQVASGLDLITDGQIRWYDPISHVAGKLENVSVNGLLRLFDTNFYLRQPVVEGPIRWTKPVLRAEYEMASAAAGGKPVKQVLTGAYTLARHSIVEYPPYQRDFQQLVLDYNEALVREVKELAAAGVPVIQIDEPSILKEATLPDWDLLEETWNRLAAAKGSTRLVLAVYFGDPAPVLHHLLAMPADVVALDFTYSPRLVDELVQVRPSKPLGLGLLDGRNTKLEDADAVVRTLERLLPQMRSTECYLNPSSGLEYLPRDRALRKLQRLVEIKRRIN
jgi:5-methyltetrahydropteroyltriglutamate--homocysteine methyltransferase